MIDGTQRTRARCSRASATQTLACAAATISGRASASRNAVARLIGKRTSVGSVGASLSFRPSIRPGGIDGIGWLRSTDRAISVRPDGEADGWAAGAVGLAGPAPAIIAVEPETRTRRSGGESTGIHDAGSRVAESVDTGGWAAQRA